MRNCPVSLLVLFGAAILFSCGDNNGDNANQSFSRADSVTDRYLAYQDSLLQSWNVMINDDNQKIIAMHNLLHELLETNKEDREELENFEEQLDQLARLRYTQRSMGNSDVIEEYDFATTTLVRELITIAESRTEFASNIALQKLVEDIRLADERVNNYRAEYDEIVAKYNMFVENNRLWLTDVSTDSLKKKHLFQMVSVE